MTDIIKSKYLNFSYKRYAVFFLHLNTQYKIYYAYLSWLTFNDNKYAATIQLNTTYIR